MRLSTLFLAAVVTLASAASTFACPICGQPTVTLSERFTRADAALLVEWVSAEPAKGESKENTTFEIVQVQRDSLEAYKQGERVTLERFTQGKPGDLYLLLGKKEEARGIKWTEAPLPVSETSFQYIVQAPSPESPAEKRLSYFLKFLEFPDYTIANDAFAEFVNAPTKDIFSLAPKLSKDKLRGWLSDPKTPLNRQSGYGLMLGLCGGPEEARFLEKRIAAREPERQIGIEGVMFGYLLLAGEQGLSTIETTLLKNASIEDGEVYPAVRAIEYYFSYGNGKIGVPRLQKAMRLVLDRPVLAETAIVDLASWKDWSLHEKLMKLYGTKNYDVKSTKEKIIKYMIASTKDVPKESAELPPHAVAGQKCLAQLRELDPKLVAETEKFYFLK